MHASTPIDRNDLHVWTIDLSDTGWDRFADVLDPDERSRFARVIVEEARNAWRRSRIALRLLLSRYLKLNPSALAFCGGERGKPMLAAPQQPLAFNVSHSWQRALIVIANGSVGIDIECMTGHEGNYARLLEMICAADELQDVQSCGPDELRASFFRLWTRKEAYCKATGHGLYKPMGSFTVHSADHASRCWVQDRAADGHAPWQLHDLPCDEGWMACVCTQLSDPRIVNQTFSPPP